MLVADKFLADILERIKKFEAETGVEVRLIKIRKESMKVVGEARDKTITVGISMEAS